MTYNRQLEIMVYPFSIDCDDEFFTSKTKFDLKVNKPVWYKHGKAEMGQLAIGEVVEYNTTENGIVAKIGLFDTPILNKLIEGHKKSALFASSASENFKVSKEGEILEWNDYEITLIDITGSGGMVPCNFKARSISMKGKCGDMACQSCSTGVKSTPEELNLLIEDIVDDLVEENMAEENVEDTDNLNNAEDTSEEPDDSKAKSAEEDETVAPKEENIFARRAAAVKSKAAPKHEDVDGYLAELVSQNIIDESEVKSQRNVLVSLKSAGNEEAIETYLDMLENRVAQDSDDAPKAKKKSAAPAPAPKIPTVRKKVVVDNYDQEIQSLAAALEEYNQFNR